MTDYFGPIRLIHVADIDPDIHRILYQSQHGATDVEVRAAIRQAETTPANCR